VVQLLTSADVSDLIDLREGMAILEQGRGAAVPWPPSLMFSGGGKLILRSGGLAETGRFGVRVTTGPSRSISGPS